MIEWTLKEVTLPLKFPWAIARGSTNTKTNFVISVTEGEFVGLGEVAWNVRFGESEEAIHSSFKDFVSRCPPMISGLESLVNVFEDVDEMPQSLRFGIESAYLHFLAKLSEKPIHEILGVNTRRSVETSFSLPLMELDKIDDFYKEHNLDRFKFLKIKLSGEASDSELVKKVAALHKGSLFLDANEAYLNVSDFLAFTEAIKDLPIEFIEQPLKSSEHEAYLELKDKSPFPIFADESLVGESITEYIAERFHGINIKLQKSGGYFKAIQQMNQAKELGLKVMIGCMVETSLGISSGLHIAANADYIDLDGFLFLKKDPYGFVLEESGKLFLANMH